MKCPACQQENPSGARFCNGCAAPLAGICPSCGSANPPDSRFCNQCAAALAGGPASAEAAGRPERAPLLHTATSRREDPPIAVALEGERKTITALFADIKGSMELLEDLDPEECPRHRPLFQLMMDAVHRYEGYVAQSTGDGIFALFGAPIAHEDHPQRACYAALRMQEELQPLCGRASPAGAQLLGPGRAQHRRGGGPLDRRRSAHRLHPLGHTIGLAHGWRAGRAGHAYLTQHTPKLIEGYFQFSALGTVEGEGSHRAGRIYEVPGVGPLRTRLQVAARRGLVRFVGRQRRAGADAPGVGVGQGEPWADRGGDGRGGSREVAPGLRVQGAAWSRSVWCWKPSRSPTARPMRICR